MPNNCNRLHYLMARNGNFRNFCISYSNSCAFYRPELNSKNVYCIQSDTTYFSSSDWLTLDFLLTDVTNVL